MHERSRKLIPVFPEVSSGLMSKILDPKILASYMYIVVQRIVPLSLYRLSFHGTLSLGISSGPQKFKRSFISGQDNP